MDVTIEKKAGHLEITPSGGLVIGESSGFIQSVLDGVRDSAADRVVLDLKEVTSMDTSGVQNLLFLKRYFESRNMEMAIINHAPPVIAAFDLYGLIAVFADKVHVKKAEIPNYDFAYGVRKSELKTDE
jgi:anti-anti-sigma factor